MADPSGCQHCGVAKRTHFGRYKTDVGWHTWTAPTQKQIKERMLARRALKAGVR